MKKNFLLALTVALAMGAGSTFAIDPAKAPKMKMTTDIPTGILTPNHMETRIGALNSDDGVPTVETAEIIYDYLDFQHGVTAFLSGIQVASMEAMRKGILTFGPPNKTVLLFEDLMDSKALFLTPNTTSVYMMMWLELKEEPFVLETPADVLGIIDDHWFKYVADFGRLGDDKNQGGKFLIVPPGYEGEIPDGYIVKHTKTYGNWVIWRGFQKDGSPKPAIDLTKKVFKCYPLSQAANPPAVEFVNVSGKFLNTIHNMDFSIYEEINEVVQSEPPYGQNPEILGYFASIGIKKGNEFKPDARMKEILSEAAEVASVTARTLISRPRDEAFLLFPEHSKIWTNPFVGGSYKFEIDGVSLLDGRAAFHFYATGITPAMAKKIIGKGSKYAVAYLDHNMNPLDGNKIYKVHVPPNVPAKDFWSFTLYDNQTRGMLQTDQRFPGLDQNKEGLVVNKDGSVDVFFGPKPPKGYENNWIQTIPNRGWNMLFRVYGPLDPWFDKTWYPGDPEVVE
ncbi:MAG: hypothetical protein B1H11_05835 [Desulfobacteraceae bacterium 4484_190.1]|nr:MAG: hypothetical protein B1H11_05835 [Desulfobacteraceae bacterium 4484_190.1]